MAVYEVACTGLWRPMSAYAAYGVSRIAFMRRVAPSRRGWSLQCTAMPAGLHVCVHCAAPRRTGLRQQQPQQPPLSAMQSAWPERAASVARPWRARGPSRLRGVR